MSQEIRLDGLFDSKEFNAIKRDGESKKVRDSEAFCERSETNRSATRRRGAAAFAE